MGLSKSTRILILLAIDSAFFLLELIVGQSKCPLERRDWTSLLTSVYCRLCCSLLSSSRGLVPYGQSLNHTSQRFQTLILYQLNDVLSLCVGLWAVRVANQETNSKMYTYGVSDLHQHGGANH